MRGWIILMLCLVPGAGFVCSAPAQTNGKSVEQLRQEAIAEFTRKTREANYPALFEDAAREFNVPAAILEGVAFAETRWEQLTWPPGETASPETGMPRPYGIMSLWDNKYFGHSLIEAAKLIGKTPEELKNDARENIRGGAALLRRIYDETPRPDGSPETELESWRFAIRKYCGIPEPDLNARHALDVYTFISQGYHQYGIEFNSQKVNLEPIRAETRVIVDEENRKKQLLAGLNKDDASNAAAPSASTRATATTNVSPATNPPPVPAPEPTSPKRKFGVILWIMLLIVLAALAAAGRRLWRKKRQ